jgi:hypothetical protein
MPLGSYAMTLTAPSHIVEQVKYNNNVEGLC